MDLAQASASLGFCMCSSQAHILNVLCITSGQPTCMIVCLNINCSGFRPLRTSCLPTMQQHSITASGLHTSTAVREPVRQWAPACVTKFWYSRLYMHTRADAVLQLQYVYTGLSRVRSDPAERSSAE